MDTCANLADETQDMTGDVVWGADSSTYFYLKMDSEHRPHELWLHSIGTPQNSDILVHAESDAKFWMGVDKTASDRFLIIQAGGKETDECHIIDLAGVQGKDAHRQVVAKKVCVRPREFGVRYEVEHHGDKFFIVTNKDGAKCSKLISVDVSAVLSGGQSQWVDVNPYNPKVQIDGILPFKKHLAVFGRENGFVDLGERMDLGERRDSGERVDSEGGMDLGERVDSGKGVDLWIWGREWISGRGWICGVGLRAAPDFDGGRAGSDTRGAPDAHAGRGRPSACSAAGGGAERLTLPPVLPAAGAGRRG